MTVRRLSPSTGLCGMAVLISIIAMPTPGYAQAAGELLQRILVLEQKLGDMKDLEAELEALKGQLESTVSAAQEAEQQAKAAERQAKAAEEQAKAAGEQAKAAERQATAAEKKTGAADRANAKWHLAGYATTSYKTTNAETVHNSFRVGQFNPVFHFQFKDIILFESEFEFTVGDDGKTTLNLEYTTLDLLFSDFAALAAGKFLSPIGQFQERLHPGWINKLPDPPAGYGHGGVQPLSEVGVMLRGGFEINPLVNYAIFVGNGPRFELENGELSKLELEGFGTDNNHNKSIGGRIGILPLPYLEIGGSFMTAEAEGLPGTSGRITEGEYSLWGADAAYTRGPWDVRFEYLRTKLTSFFGQKETGQPTELIPTTEWEVWYAQIAYQLSGLTDTPIIRNLEPVVRYGEVDVQGFAHFVDHLPPEQRWTVGLNYLFAPSVIAKLASSWRSFDNPALKDSFELWVQLAYGY